jgi:hypothetical protein
MPENTSAEKIKAATLEILNYPFQTPLPARKFLEPVLRYMGYIEKSADDNSSTSTTSS